MRGRIVVALVAAAVISVVVANDLLPAASVDAADWARPRVVKANGLEAYYPRSWHATVRSNTIVIGSTHTSVWLARYGPERDAAFPGRPAHFLLNDEDRRFQSCGFDFVGWNLTFADNGQVVQAIVRVDPGAPKSDATGILDRLRISS